MKEHINKLKAEIDRLESEIEKIQDNCDHKNIIYKMDGSSGNWDRDDSYWYDIICLDCGLRYTNPQEYPYLQDKTAFEIKNQSLTAYENATVEELKLLKKYGAL